eukprot:2030297-Rhodomonas_salina.3
MACGVQMVQQCGTEIAYGAMGCGLLRAYNVQICGTEIACNVQICGTERAYNVQICGTEIAYNAQIYGTARAYNVQIYGTERAYNVQIYKQFLTNKILKDPKQRRAHYAMSGTGIAACLSRYALPGTEAARVRARFFKVRDLHDLFTLGDDTVSAYALPTPCPALT